MSMSDLPIELETPVPAEGAPSSAATAQPAPAPDSPAASLPGMVEPVRKDVRPPASPLELPIDGIVPNPHQPRRTWNEGTLAELAASIRSTGLIQPVIVRKAGDSYQLVAGENLNDYSRFPTLTCRSVGGTLTGAVEAANLLYSDDLIEDREESLNPLRLESKYQAYLNQLLDRKKDGCKELMVGTRWNVGDPLGRIEAQYKDNPRYRFRKIPALNENDESNFVYEYGLGFSTEYYRDYRDKLDKNEWMAKYQQAPYIREGLLLPADELNYYNGTLPGVEPDRKLFACDVAWGGGDSLSMPICYKFGDAGYIHDVVFNRGNKEVTRPLVVGKILQHKLNMGRFEANNGGDEYADKVDENLRKLDYKCNISHRKAPSNQAKMTRIIQYAPEIKRLYFIDDKHASPEYRKFISELTTTVQVGKNEHDDAADSMAQLVAFMENGGGYVEVFQRPF
jgi:predicted phage terminase large subunit-like protein